MRAATPLLLALLLALATRNIDASSQRAEDFAPSSAARGSEWFRAFRATFDDSLAQRFANPGACTCTYVEVASHILQKRVFLRLLACAPAAHPRLQVRGASASGARHPSTAAGSCAARRSASSRLLCFSPAAPPPPPPTTSAPPS
jgi:hypothetical protein